MFLLLFHYIIFVHEFVQEFEAFIDEIRQYL